MNTQTQNTVNRETATRLVVAEFYMECFKRGLTAIQAAAEAVKYESEIKSRIEGLAKEI